MDFAPDTLLYLLSEDLSDYDDNLAAQQLKKSILKKYVAPGTCFKDAAFESFLERNKEILAKDPLPVHRKALLEQWRYILHRIFLSDPYQSPVLTIRRCVDWGLPGPGSSYKVKHTDFLNKMFASPLTMTSSRLGAIYRSCLTGRWRDAENFRLANHSDLVVEGSRLDTVPKDCTRDRTICIEPSLNMFFQKGAQTILEGLLKRFYNVDVSTQPNINKMLARQGSIDDSLATIDLKDASDSIHTTLVQYLLPPEVYNVLDAIRSQRCYVGNELVKLNMFSTMGCGFTFPLMTLLFCTMLEAFCVVRGVKPFRNGVDFAVFGDDIIVPTAHAPDVCKLLSDVSFTVNLEKSFLTGSFKESCGGDYYSGRDVRGVYIKRMDHEKDVYTAFNRLTRWSCKHGVPLNRVLLYLAGLAEFRPIPLYENIDGGIIVSHDFVSNLAIKPGVYRYRKLDARPKSRRVTKHPNTDGVLVSLLGGYVRNGRIVTRRPKGSTPDYRVVRRVSPCWDYTMDPVLNARDVWFTLAELLSFARVTHVGAIFLR